MGSANAVITKALVLAIGATLLLGAAGATADWRQVEAVALNADATHRSDYTDIAEVGGVPYVAWTEQNGNLAELYVARLRSDGSWERVSGRLYSSPTFNASGPSIASVNGVPYVAWTEYQMSNSSIHVAALGTDGNWHLVAGTIFAATSGQVHGARIVGIGGRPYLTWHEVPSNGFDKVRVGRLGDDGQWHVVGGEVYANASKDEDQPDIADVGGVPYVTWREYSSGWHTWVARLGSDDLWHVVGASLYGRAGADALAPRIASVGGVPYVTWQEHKSPDYWQLWVARLGDDGNWHIVGGALNGDGTRIINWNRIAAVSGVPYVAWLDHMTSEVRVARTESDGAWHRIGGSANGGVPNGDRPSIASIGGIPWVASVGSATTRVTRLEPEFLSASATPTRTGAKLTTTVSTFGLPYEIGFLYTNGGPATQRTSTDTAPLGAETVTVNRTVGNVPPGEEHEFQAFARAGTPYPLVSELGGTFTPDATPPALTLKRTGRTKFAYTLSEPARIVLTVERRRPGRKVAGRCVKETRSNRSRPKCNRWVFRARVARSAPAGESTARFDLPPGDFRARLVATDAVGNRAARPPLRFRVEAP